MSRRTSLVSSLLLTFTILIYSAHSASGTVRYLCREFSPNFAACGYNTNPNSARWLGSTVRYLPKVSANLDELQEWVLLMNGTAAATSVGKYELAIQSLSSGDYCVQFAALYSDNCLFNRQINCNVDFQFASTATSVVNASRVLHYREGQWSLFSYEFHLQNGVAMKPVLIGTVEHPTRYVPGQTPYIAIKFIDVLDGRCPARIGTRVSLWIMIMVIFGLLTTYTFVHIAITGMIDSHRSRKAKAEALGNSDVAYQLKSHRSPSTASYAY